ncbi:uncharacterized protein CMU_027220 [Cryptosporidium muris RN66]|uniref:Uncharacterized protein n=1 Tax=Cryptosporidium muris (strain RN66) TaxID=441375 RepID=B6ABG1_CRYMR|nr:uncharacterized protein CMU_027220 [Cryptosporidium muris RN66]EEA05713.1 hypothetical protein CMU_027220 [Cryptosporidium muris RN66]|eukprot:XP_002140062.1 hypothetical protein [Cryptosporidium muris RN66]
MKKINLILFLFYLYRTNSAVSTETVELKNPKELIMRNNSATDSYINNSTNHKIDIDKESRLNNGSSINMNIQGSISYPEHKQNTGSAIASTATRNFSEDTNQTLGNQNSRNKTHEAMKIIDNRDIKNTNFPKKTFENSISNNEPSDTDNTTDQNIEIFHSDVLAQLYQIDNNLKKLHKMARNDKKLLIQIQSIAFLADKIKEQIARDVSALNETVGLEVLNGKELNKLQSLHENQVKDHLNFIKHENIVTVKTGTVTGTSQS